MLFLIFLILLLSPLNLITGKEINDEEMKNMLLSLLPSELMSFYENLTPREKKLLDEMSIRKNNRLHYDSESNYIYQSVYPKLLSKMITIYTVMRQKIEELSNEPREFFHTMMEISKKMNLGYNDTYENIKEYVQIFSLKFRNLPLNSKNELIREYPLMKILSNEEYYNEMMNDWLKDEVNLLKFNRILRFLFLIS